MSRSGLACLACCITCAPACAPAEALAARLQSCGLLTAGDLGPTSLAAFYAPDACYQDCLARADCEALAGALCRSDLELLLRCDERCAFHCEDDSLVGVERVCDGVEDCDAGEDERGCPGREVTCASGARVTGARCDGLLDCGDGSDERGCSPRCGDGSYFGEWDRCDGYRRCADGSDEAGCPTYTCGDGRVLTYRSASATPRCNGWSQCFDGSDEAGCATLVVSCGG